MPGPFPYASGHGSTLAPACEVRLSWNGNSMAIRGVIDSGASRTLIPDELVAQLQLRKVRENIVSGATEAQGKVMGYYIVNIEFLGLRFDNHTVIAGPKSYILIGREILNRYRTHLDGPQLQFSID